VTRRRTDDVDAEVEFHLTTRIEALQAQGLSPETARTQALREFGDVDDAREYMRRLDRQTRASRSRRDYMGDFRQDVLYALRRLRSAPAFAVTAILTIALGIGANAAIFSVVNGVVFRPLPFPDPDRLYAVYSANPEAQLLRASVSPVDLDDWRARRQRIDDIGGYWYAEGNSGVNMLGRGSPRRLSSVFFTPGFLPALGVQAAHGRLPREDELVRGGPHEVVLLTHGFWLREFGGDASVVGTTLNLNERPYTVIGVLPATLRYPAPDADVFVPYSTIPDDSIPRLRQVRVLSVVARARPGASEDDVRTEMAAITKALSQEFAEDRAWGAATVVPLEEVIVGPVRQGLIVLLGAVGLVLLMACVNVASLQLARAIGRGREMALRLALGARRGRLIRQLITESLVLSVIGGAIGLVLARWGIDALLALTAGQLPRTGEVALDAAVVAFAAALSVLTGLLFGVVPALRGSRADGDAALREGARGATSAGHRGWRVGLIVAEVAISMMLVVGAGLMGRSFLALTQVDAGFDPRNILAVQFTLDPDRYGPRDPDAGPTSGSPYALVYQQIIDRVRQVPGIIAAAAVKDPPYRGNGERWGFRIAGQTLPAGAEPPTATALHVSEGYFATIGARMVEGREFTARDNGSAPPVIVVNQAFARRHFPGRRAAGQYLLIGGEGRAEIIGVVNDIRQVAVAEPAQPALYLHNLQNSRVKTTIVARTAGDPLAMAPAVRAAIWEIEPQQPITTTFTFADAVSRALARPRLLAVLLGAFGIVGLALGAIGIYGLLASSVSEQRREIGVRMALGARPEQVRASVVRRGVIVTAVGVAIGLAGAIGLSRFLATVLYGVGPLDPVTFAGMAAVLMGVAAAASWLPARRASALSPLDALRRGE
jgi:predicted permease